VSAVEIYTQGLCYASACVEAGLTLEEIERAANIESPTGIKSRWAIAEGPFADGTPNPTPCENDATRKHVLLVC